MKVLGLMLFSLALAAQTGVDIKVESSFDKKANFTSFHTYRWANATEAANPKAHALIVAAIDAEMNKSGLSMVKTGGDVTVAYYTVASTNIDMKEWEKMQRSGRSGPTPTNTVGRLLVVVRGPSSMEPIWSASTREVIDPDPAKLGDTIQKVTARLFETYPTRTPAPKK